MHIVFATGPATETGGNAKYAQELSVQFKGKGHTVLIVTYGVLEKILPAGLRHVVFFMRVFFSLIGSDIVVSFDTFSVGVPACVAAHVLGKPSIVRIGGDFLWEHYVERTGDLIKLSQFYANHHTPFSFREKCIYRGTKYLLKKTSILAFNTHWQIGLWKDAYDLPLQNARVIENVFPAKKVNHTPHEKVFVAAGRPIKLKQDSLLRELFSEIERDHPGASLDQRSLTRGEHQVRVENSYAVVLASVSDISPNAIIDAVVYGKPFICTEDTGITERISGLGIFIDTQNKEALTKAIISLLNPKIYEEYKSKIAHFSYVRNWEQVADDFLTNINVCVS